LSETTQTQYAHIIYIYNTNQVSKGNDAKT
jgi:hypothetical protein